MNSECFAHETFQQFRSASSPLSSQNVRRQLAKLFQFIE